MKLISETACKFVRTSLLAGCLIGTISACTTKPPHQPEAETAQTASAVVEPEHRIAVATAYGPELAALLPALRNSEEININGVSFWTGDLEDEAVVLFKTGVSTVNAAMNMQLALDHFEVSHILVSGVAGGLDPDLSIGDVAIPARWAKYDETTYMRKTDTAAYVAYPGHRELAPSFGFIGLRGVRIATTEVPDPEPKVWFEADPALIAIAQAAAVSAELAQCDDEGLCLPEAPEIVSGGSGVTGSVFMDNREYRDYLHDVFDAQVVEMETAAIAMVAYANDIPFIAFRSLSDLAGGGHAGANEIKAFEHLAARNSAALVLAYMKTYSEGVSR